MHFPVVKYSSYQLFFLLFQSIFSQQLINEDYYMELCWFMHVYVYTDALDVIEAFTLFLDDLEGDKSINIPQRPIMHCT